MNILEKKRWKSFFSETEISNFAQGYELNAGSIKIVLDNISLKELKADKGRAFEKITILLDKQLNLVNGEEKKSSQDTYNYSLDGLNMNISPQEVLDTLRLFLERVLFMRVKLHRLLRIMNWEYLMF